MTLTRTQIGRLRPARALYEFVEQEALPGTGLSSERFWNALEAAVHDLTPRVRAALADRDRLQGSIDEFHASAGGAGDAVRYQAFLRELGYLADAPDHVEITTDGLDDEVAAQPGPQLVVPVLNSRFAVNAANARWGSLYDALYSSDAIPRQGELAPGDSYNPVRGAAVIERGRQLLDEVAPLAAGSHADAAAYTVDGKDLAVRLADGSATGLVDARAFVGYRGVANSPDAVVLVHHGLHVEIQIDSDDPVGAADAAGVKDLVLESAVTTIMDLEDSVAAVDTQDKVLGYRNWLGLMRGTLQATVSKNGSSFVRTMNPDRELTSPDRSTLRLHGRSLLFIRHVGHHMFTDAVIDETGADIPEGILDAFVTALCALHDIRGLGDLRNSRAGAMYVVKPKMHGPDEVMLSVDLLDRVEQALELPTNSIKIGIMDEERRTSLNLAACIAAASQRIAFINTGFLDRTGDEIHTSMRAGAMMRKADMRNQEFLSGYEANNVDVGLAAGFAGRAQIGKGMWAMPDLMADMLATKAGQLQAGASTAWVPSPTAATLHAIHYHQVDVAEMQAQLATRPLTGIDPLLRIPVAPHPDWSNEDRQQELDNNSQSILGYVVRWVDQGIGCSKVPDNHDVALMEDRATLRISSQLLANWLMHGVVTEDDIDASLRRQARVVDEQNAHDPAYRPLGDGSSSLAYAAARELILRGSEQPNGYTEAILHHYRRTAKANSA